MNNTALRAEKEITNTIIFRNEKHKDFYQTYMKKCRRQDVYHKALIYCLGISEDTRINIGGQADRQMEEMLQKKRKDQENGESG